MLYGVYMHLEAIGALCVLVLVAVRGPVQAVSNRLKSGWMLCATWIPTCHPHKDTPVHMYTHSIQYRQTIVHP
jgi:hypothetical protein